MVFRSFRHHYHDGHLAGFSLGPRRELVLEIALDLVWNKAAASSDVRVRFGAIENFDEVSAYFRALRPRPGDGAYLAEIVGLRYVSEGPNWVTLDLAGQGHIRIRARHVEES